MKKKQLTKKQKVNALAHSPEVINATKLMLACMINIKAKDFVSVEYQFGELLFELKLTRIKRKSK